MAADLNILKEPFHFLYYLYVFESQETKELSFFSNKFSMETQFN